MFYDLGSGRGRLVLAMAAMFPGIKRSHGIELVKERYDVANASAPLDGSAPVTFSHGSFLDDDASFPLTDATWVYVSNICFSDEVNAALAQKLGRALPPRALVISSKRLDDPELTRVDKGTISQTWNPASPVYVYRKQSSVGGGGGGASAPVHAAMSKLNDNENFAGGARVPVYYVGHASSPSRRRKKYVVVLNNGRRVYFGDPSVADFTKHHDVARRREYLRRHTARAGVETPEFWERWLLWNKPSKRASIRDLERTLRVEIKPLASMNKMK